MSHVSIFMLFCVVLFAIFWLILMVFFFAVMRPWLRAAACGVPVSIFSVVGMRLRGSPPQLMVDAYIVLKRAGVNCTIADVEGVYIDNRRRVRKHDDLVELVKKKTSQLAKTDV